MTVIIKKYTFKISIILFLVLFQACVGNRIKPNENINLMLQKENKEPSVAIKRNIKDIDFKSRLEEKSPKKRVVILPFLDLSSERPESARTLAREAFMDDLNKSNEVIALDSNQLKVDVTKYIQAGQYDLTKLAQDIQNAGVSSVVEGKIIDLRIKKDNEKKGIIQQIKTSFEAVVRMRILNVRSGKELFHVVKTVTIEDEDSRVAQMVSSEQFFLKNPELVTILIKDAFLDFTPQVITSMNEITWEGRIAALKGEKIYLNVGRVSGVQIGDILKVVEDGSEIYDPEIGYHLGKISGQVKGTLEIVSYFGQDGAVSVIHSGAGFKENDRVELYQ